MKPITCHFSFPGQPAYWGRGSMQVLYQWALLGGNSPYDGPRWEAIRQAVDANNPATLYVLDIERWGAVDGQQKDAAVEASRRWVNAVQAITGARVATWARQPRQTWDWDGILTDAEKALTDAAWAAWPSEWWTQGDNGVIAAYFSHQAPSSLNSLDRWMKYTIPMLDEVAKRRMPFEVIVAISPLSFAKDDHRLVEPYWLTTAALELLERGYRVMIWAGPGQTKTIPWDESHPVFQELIKLDAMGLMDRGQ